MNFAFLLKPVLSFLESHPQVVEELVEQLFTYIVAELKKANAARQ